MKKIFLKSCLLLLLLATIVDVDAQPPYVYSSGQQWNVLIGSVYGNQLMTSVYHADNQYANVNGVIYKILFVDSDDIINVYRGLFREINGKILYRELDPYQNAGPEYVLYDWTMEVGDVTYVRYGEATRGLVLDQITDTVLNGVERRVFHLHYENDIELTEIWIEGIGSELGFLYSGTKNNPESLIAYAALLCYYEDGNTTWDNPDYDSCVISYWASEEEEKEDDVSVYPNPTKGIFTVRLIEQGTVTINVYDVMGRRLLNYTGTGEHCTVDISHLPNGIYYVLMGNDGITSRTTIIKQ